MAPATMRLETRKANMAILVNFCNSDPLGAMADLVRDLVSLLVVFASTWSAKDSEAAVEALVDDLNLEDIMAKKVICFGLGCKINYVKINLLLW